MLTFLLSLTEESDHGKIIYIYNTFHGDMLKLAKHRLRLAGIKAYEYEAEDAVQNAFVKLAKYISRVNFEGGEKTLRAYVMSVTANEVRNLLNDIKKTESIREYREDISEEMSEDDFFEHLQIEDGYAKILEKIKHMDERYSSALMMFYCEEMSVKEIAGALGVPEKTVYTRLSRGRKLLTDNVKGEV